LPMPDLVELRTNLASRITDPVIEGLSRSGINPDALTLTGLAINIGAAYLIATGHFLPAGLLILVAGLCDLLDGALARFVNQTTKFGALFDSTADRISEAALFFGLIVWYMLRGSAMGVMLASAALIGSFLVSYIRARAEGLGLECKVGLFTRAERVIVLTIGLVVNQVTIALWVLVVFAYITVIQRLVYLRQQTRK
jgi:CDP-diacylglycerol--glycerol-3-phosphate 3-phosphatidyltransferase